VISIEWDAFSGAFPAIFFRSERDEEIAKHDLRFLMRGPRAMLWENGF